MQRAAASCVADTFCSDHTITVGRVLREGRRESQEYVSHHARSRPHAHDFRSEIRILAVSTRITELSYAISDIETRIFGVWWPGFVWRRRRADRDAQRSKSSATSPSQGMRRPHQES